MVAVTENFLRFNLYAPPPEHKMRFKTFVEHVFFPSNVLSARLERTNTKNVIPQNVRLFGRDVQDVFASPWWLDVPLLEQPVNPVSQICSTALQSFCEREANKGSPRQSLLAWALNHHIVASRVCAEDLHTSYPEYAIHDVLVDAMNGLGLEKSRSGDVDIRMESEPIEPPRQNERKVMTPYCILAKRLQDVTGKRMNDS